MKISTLFLRGTLLLFAAAVTTLGASVSVEDLAEMLEDQLAEKIDKKQGPAPQPPGIVFEQSGGEDAITDRGTLSPFPALMARRVMDTPPMTESGASGDGRHVDGKETAGPFNDKMSGADSAGLELAIAAAEGGPLQEVSQSTEGTAHDAACTRIIRLCATAQHSG